MTVKRARKRAARPAQPVPRRESDPIEDDLSPEQRFEAVAMARDFARGTAERLADAKQDLERMTSLNYPRLVDRFMLAAQERAVDDLEASLVEANGAYQRALEFFDSSPGSESYWLDLIAENDRELRTARARRENAFLRQRAAEHHDDPAEASRAGRALGEAESQISRRSERARTLSGGRTLMLERRRPAPTPRTKVEAAPGARVLRASGSLTCNGVQYEAGDVFTDEELRRINPRNLDALLERGLVYWDDPREELIVARAATIGGREYLPGDRVVRGQVARTAPVLLAERQLRREVVSDDDLPPAA